MSDDNSKQNQAADERETTKDRVEREHRRKDEGDADTESDNEPSVDEDSIRSGQPEPANDAVEGTDVEQLDVPQFTIDRASQLDSAKQIAELPAGNRPIKTPQIQTRSKPVLDANDLAEPILVESEVGTTDIPQFTIGTTNKLTPIELDDDQLESIGLIQQSQIPQVSIENRHRVQPFSTFLETIPETTAEDTDVEAEVDVDEPAVEEKQAVVDVTQTREGATDTLEEFGTENEWPTGEWPDPLELLFGSGGTDIKSDNPLVVLVNNDDLVGIVETLVKRRYREIEGGEPEAQKLDTANQLADEERWLSADSQIFTAELRDEEWAKLEDGEYQEEWQSICRNRLDQLYSGQQFGAIIFNRSNIPKIDVTSHHLPTRVKLDQEVDWKDIARVYWANVDEVEPGRARTFSQIFDRDEDGIARNRWETIMGTADGKFKSATENDDAASSNHYALKVFVVKWLAEQLWEAGEEFGMYDRLADIEDYREIEEKIPTEHPIPVGNNEHVRPDLQYGSQVFEVEMFFGEADESGFETKLQKTARKYEDIDGQIDTINIVMDNLTCILHLNDLARFKRNHQPWETDHVDINLYTVDLGQEDLVPIHDIVDGITSLSSS